MRIFFAVSSYEKPPGIKTCQGQLLPGVFTVITGYHAKGQIDLKDLATMLSVYGGACQ